MHPWKGLTGLPRAIWLISFSTLVNRLGTMALPFLVLYLTEARRWTPAEAGTAMMVYGLGALTAAPFAGKLADRLGHARVLRASLWLSGGALLVMPLVGNRLLLYPLIFLWAGFTQAFWPSAMALITNLVEPGQRKAAFALHRAAVNLGMAVGPAAGGLIAHFSYRWVFWVDGLSTLASGVLLVWLLGPDAAPTPGREGEVPKSAWRDRRLLGLLLGLLPAFLVFFQIEGAYPLWVVRDLGHSTRFFGLIFTVNTLLIVLFEVALNMAMVRWPHGRALALGCLCYAVGFGLTGLASTKAALVGLTVIWTFGEMILLPTASDAVAGLAPPERRGEYMGFYALTFATALALGPWLGVKAYASADPQWLWAGCLASGSFSALVLWRFRVAPTPAP
ncbi:MAG: MFS transporter [Acidobacteria bacterium]|nr:MFS transporter [Acidobacteriota bacterium]